VIPESSTLGKFASAKSILRREIAGVPLLIRVIATGARAGVDKLLIVWPPDVDRSIWAQCALSPLVRNLKIEHLVRQFDPRQASNWTDIAQTVQESFYWLPWNWVTHKRALMGLARLSAKPESWNVAALLTRRAVLGR